MRRITTERIKGMALPTITLKHDKTLTIATGASRRAVRWVNTEMKWSELVSRLSVPTRTRETVSEYQHMAKAKRDVIKDVGGFVGGSLKGGRRRAENVLERNVITLDLDTVPTGVDVWGIVEMTLDCAACIYSTHSHTESSPRLRLVIPLARPISPDEYGAISRRLAADIDIDYCDDTTYDPCRLMYWASCSVDADYVFEYSDAPLLDPDSVLDRYHDWTDTAEWPTSSRRKDIIARQAKHQGNPIEKPGVIGAFCKTYDIPAAIREFLPDTYLEAGDGRYTYAKGSTTAGLVLYEDGAFAYSHHGTDPAGDRLVNSFDLVRLHRFAELDEDSPEDTAINQLPSYKAMNELALADEAVAYQLTLDRVDAFDAEDGDPVDTEWLKSLELTGRGDIASTIDNVRIILTHDPRLCGSFYYDSFKERPIICGDLPWIALAERASMVWSDTDDAGLRSFLEYEYKIATAAKIRDAVDLAMMQNTHHPVREYLDSLIWDGNERAETVFIDYLGAKDTAYTRAVTKAALVGAVARIMKPGCKHDHMLVLVGPQGCRKSTTLAKLGRQWFSDSLYTVSGKDAYEQLQGFWIIEMGEMAAARKSEIESLKQFMSKQSDSYRAAYGRRTQEHMRQCAFFGSTNDFEFLRDQTGARRFWPVEVTAEGKTLADGLTEEIVDQIWAECYAAYKDGAVWYLTSEEEALAAEVQEEHTQISDLTGMVMEFVGRKVPEGWMDYTIEQRRDFWSDDFGEAEEAATEERIRVCVLEIWCELLKGDPKMLTRAMSREIGDILRSSKLWVSENGASYGPYGRQRGFRFVGKL